MNTHGRAANFTANKDETIRKYGMFVNEVRNLARQGSELQLQEVAKKHHIGMLAATVIKKYLITLGKHSYNAKQELFALNGEKFLQICNEYAKDTMSYRSRIRYTDV